LRSKCGQITARVSPMKFKPNPLIKLRSRLVILALGGVFLSNAFGASFTESKPSGAWVPLETSGIYRWTLESAPIPLERAFDLLIPSWEAKTPPNSWISLEIRVKMGDHWSRYYSFGTWRNLETKNLESAQNIEAKNASLDGQKDVDGKVSTDTLTLERPATALQYRVKGYSGRNTPPKVTWLGFTTDLQNQSKQDKSIPDKAVSDKSIWGTILEVPQRSQMVFKEGEGWCSPTSTSMVLAYYGVQKSVPEVAKGVFDATYGGTGNWAFNVAYASSLGFRSHVARLSSMTDLERLIAAGQPIPISVGWKKGELTGAAVPSSAGHLMVVVGFDKQGNVVVNDPAGKTDSVVRRTYDRGQLERIWLGHSGGVAYLISKS
jgi:uncharacterized protein YvpB